MTRDELLDDLAELEAHIDQRVEIWREIIAPDGKVIERIYSGAFQAPKDWTPPQLDDLITSAKGRTHQKQHRTGLSTSEEHHD